MIDLDQIRYAADGTAWKTPSMRGYIYKDSLEESDYGAGAFKLRFVPVAATNVGTASETGVTDYYFGIDPTKAQVANSAAANAATANGSVSLVLDYDLLRYMLSGNWQQGTFDEYETARSGNGGLW